jgi:hypothetical protein
MIFSAPPPLPSRKYDDDESPIDVGEWVVFPISQGVPFSVQFTSPFEPYFTTQGERVSLSHRSHSIWLHRALPALYRALGTQFAALGVEIENTLIIQDLIDIESEQFLDHLTIRRKLDVCQVAQPPYAALGPVGNRHELNGRLRSLYAVGTTLEARQEEGTQILHRRKIQLGLS